MEEKAKSKVLIYIIAVLVGICILIIIGGFLGYKSINKKINMAQNNNSNDQEIQNILQNEENINEEDTDDYIEKTTKIIDLNGEKNKVEISIKRLERTTPEDSRPIWNLEYSMNVNGKNIQNIDNGAGILDENNYSICVVKDQNNENEYIGLKIYKHYLAGMPEVTVYIIDKNANVLGKIEEKGREKFNINAKRDADGNVIDSGEFAEELSVYFEGAVRYVSSQQGVEKHFYTMVDGKLIDKIEKVYSFDEIWTEKDT